MAVVFEVVPQEDLLLGPFATVEACSLGLVHAVLVAMVDDLPEAASCPLLTADVLAAGRGDGVCR